MFDFLGCLFILQRPGADLADPPQTTGSSSAKHKPHSLFFEYDAGNLRTLAYDGRGIRIAYHYDALDTVLVTESPNVQDFVNQVSQLTVRQVMERDDLGRIAANGTFFGALGPSMVLNNVQVQELDSLGRLHQESYLYQGGGATPLDINRTYTDIDDPASLTYSNGLQVATAFDTAARLQTIDVHVPGTSNRRLADYAHLGSAVNQ